MASFFSIGLNCFKAVEAMRGGRLLLTIKPAGVANTHLIELRDERLGLSWSHLVGLKLGPMDN